MLTFGQSQWRNFEDLDKFVDETLERMTDADTLKGLIKRETFDDWDGKTTMKLRFAACILSVLFLAPMANGAIALSDLVDNNGSLTVGDLVFDQFAVSYSGEMPSPEFINVVELDSSGNYGIRIQGGFLDYPVNGPSELTVSYRVTPTDSAAGFLSSTLMGNPTAIVNGSIGVTSTFAGLGNSLNIYDSTVDGTDLLDSTVFDSPQSELNVSFTVDAASTDGAVTLSFVDQTFTTGGGVVPEMSSVVGWSLTMLLGLVGLKYRRKK